MLKTAFKDKELRKKILLTLFILLVIEALAGIPTPGVNTSYFKQIMGDTNSVFNLISGNGLGNLSITMLSITPYITASIIIQLMAYVIPALNEMQKDGETGMEKIKKITIVLGVALALMESLGFAVGFGRQGLLISYKWYWVLCVTAIWTIMALMLMLAGEFIDKKGFGNGISLILLCNIISSYPSDFITLFNKFIKGQTVGNTVLHGTAIIVFLVAIFAFTVFVQETEKRIPMQYSNKSRGYVKAENSMFPIKLCPGSVVPIIFALSVMSVPPMIAQFMNKNTWFTSMLSSNNWFNADKPSYSIGALIYVVLIFGFSYFYVDMILNPLEIANNLKKSGGTIPGIRPGKPTADYLDKQIKITTMIGAGALSLIALVPCVLTGVFGLSKLAFAGTSIIITVGVILETYDKLDAETKIQTSNNHRLF